MVFLWFSNMFPLKRPKRPPLIAEAPRPLGDIPQTEGVALRRPKFVPRAHEDAAAVLDGDDGGSTIP